MGVFSGQGNQAKHLRTGTRSPQHHGQSRPQGAGQRGRPDRALRKGKKEISVEAKKHEAKRDEARIAATQASDRSREMGLAISVFQIAIALGGVTLVVKQRWLWTVSLFVGVVATLQMARVLWWM
ncbi:MAG: DUF4337 family protein [Opitutus sp.]|nr:DUF4337 family protein [Opitutus sp.]